MIAVVVLRKAVISSGLVAKPTEVRSDAIRALVLVQAEIPQPANRAAWCAVTLLAAVMTSAQLTGEDRLGAVSERTVHRRHNVPDPRGCARLLRVD